MMCWRSHSGELPLMVEQTPPRFSEIYNLLALEQLRRRVREAERRDELGGQDLVLARRQCVPEVFADGGRER
eukprot:1733538-Heterocapsa_arctica.AAC.1